MKGNTSDEAYESLIKRERMYRQIVESSAETIIMHADYKVLYINESGAKFLRAAKEDIIGACVLDIFQEDCKAVIKERIQKSIVENEPGELIEQTIFRLDGTLVDVEMNCNPIMFDDKKAVQSVLRNITQRKETERTLKKALQEISTLSAPLVPVIEGIAVLPLVGSIDSYRAKYLLDDIPSKIKQQSVACLIIDFSGIYTLDTMVTDYLFKINDVLHLLGVRSIITGIRPELAQIAVQLGVDLSSVPTFATVKQALHYLGVKKSS
jgi:rsbT co-antagonist protein RsbR